MTIVLTIVAILSICGAVVSAARSSSAYRRGWEDGSKFTNDEWKRGLDRL